MLVGVAIALVGAREVFRLLLESVEASPALARRGGAQRSLVRTLLVVGLTLALATLWLLLRNPFAIPEPTSVRTCNGHEALCERHAERHFGNGGNVGNKQARVAGRFYPDKPVFFIELIETF